MWWNILWCCSSSSSSFFMWTYSCCLPRGQEIKRNITSRTFSVRKYCVVSFAHTRIYKKKKKISGSQVTVVVVAQVGVLCSRPAAKPTEPSAQHSLIIIIIIKNSDLCGGVEAPHKKKSDDFNIEWKKNKVKFGRVRKTSFLTRDATTNKRKFTSNGLFLWWCAVRRCHPICTHHQKITSRKMIPKLLWLSCVLFKKTTIIFWCCARDYVAICVFFDRWHNCVCSDELICTIKLCVLARTHRPSVRPSDRPLARSPPQSHLCCWLGWSDRTKCLCVCVRCVRVGARLVLCLRHHHKKRVNRRRRRYDSCTAK